MKKVFIPSKGPEDWKAFLADPDKQWKSGYSARALAYCWEEADGFPACVRSVFSNSGLSLLGDMELLLALPEYQVMLPGGLRPSQNDIMVLARSQGELITSAVEGKVRESFGPTVQEWLKDASTGKKTRLDFLCKWLDINVASLNKVRYQLLHRSVSALICAELFKASTAIMLVHSFSQEHTWFEDYRCFAELLGDNDPKPCSVIYAGNKRGIDLYLGWTTGNKRYLEV